jgi:uncharacterized protein DUF4197
MRDAILRLVAATVVLAWPACAMAQLDSITQREAVAGLKAALERGSQQAVATLGRADGFLGNPQVKIPLPDSLQRAEKLMRRVGAGRYADEVIVAMNRAAEQAVPEARQILIGALKQMSVQDAKGILAGGETAGTDYFRRTTRSGLHKRFLPIVRRATARVKLAQKYNRYADRGVAFGVVREEHADLDQYVTQKALDGLYFMVAEEEKKIRKDPVGTGKAILKKVFGALL